MVMSTSLLTSPATSKLPPPSSPMFTSKLTAANASTPNCHNPTTMSRRELAISIAAGNALLYSSSQLMLSAPPALASGVDEEYTKETSEVIGKVRTTIGLDKADPNVASAVAELREASNSWVAKYRREKSLLGRASFRDVYSALNAVSGHYISFGPTAPIPAKRKTRILEEVDTAEKALIRGR
ncbi:photosystem II 11 kD protein [Iris pallida]|uniref:Photosystem II 11 kD protein n=1 Tax=Iris pallida TaxID=29817 RepID=A0AAX6F3E4_IRIPA|nr:photosystem II 11 kD protein [Iris pallida]